MIYLAVELGSSEGERVSFSNFLRRNEAFAAICIVIIKLIVRILSCSMFVTKFNSCVKPCYC